MLKFISSFQSDLLTSSAPDLSNLPFQQDHNETLTYVNSSTTPQNTEENLQQIVSAPSEASIPVENISSTYSLVKKLEEKYKGKVVSCTMEKYPHCEVILCGAIHVTQASSAMVEDVIQEVKPQFIMLELCEARVDTLLEVQEVRNITLRQVFEESFHARSVRTLGMGLLSWMQLKAANILGSQLGREQATAAKVGTLCGAMLILGDRLYEVTIQRIFDRLGLMEKIRFIFIFLWEVLTLSVHKLKEYVSKSETEDGFIANEIERFGKHLPGIAETVINERDEYMAQTIAEIARVGFGPPHNRRNGRVVAVVGAGHLIGLQKWLRLGGISSERLHAISTSSKHLKSCWPGNGSLQVVNVKSLFPELFKEPSPTTTFVDANPTASFEQR